MYEYCGDDGIHPMTRRARLAKQPERAASYRFNGIGDGGGGRRAYVALPFLVYRGNSERIRVLQGALVALRGTYLAKNGLSQSGYAARDQGFGTSTRALHYLPI